jgi:hypothetical protein
VKDELQEAKARLSLSRLMAELGFGDRAEKSARCMFHDDTSASFSVFVGDDGQERWKCFAGCGQGDAIEFLAKHRGLSNADACHEFLRLAGVPRDPRPPTRPTDTPASAPQPRPPFDWLACVAAFSPDHGKHLADWRGYAPRFVAWLREQSLIGLFDGERVGFPVHNADGRVVGCHYRLEENGSWRYHPTGTRTAPLVVGDTAQAKTVFAFESQWDLLAVLDVLHWHIHPPDATFAIATRGASNGRLVAGRCQPDAVVHAFGQNDEPGRKWVAAVAAACGCKCVQVVTPQPHKDINDWCRAGMTRRELDAAIGAAQPVSTLTVPNLHAAAPARVSALLTALAPEVEDEPEARCPFPVASMPAAMGAIVTSVSRCERVPLALPAVCALGVASAAIGSGLEVRSGPNRITRSNLFLLASAESGSGKSETFRLVAAPLVDRQACQLEVWKQKVSPELQAEIRVLDKEVGALERKAAKTSDPMERARLVGELEFKLARKDDLVARAAMPCTIAQDVTTERLAVLLRDNHETIFSASADARKLVDNLLGRYNPGKTTDESLYLSGFSGDFVRVDRQGRDTVVLHRPCLALCWFIQPDLLATMLGEESLSASGFLARLLVCHTHATPQRIEGDAPPLSESARNQWAQLIADLLTRFHDAEKPRTIEPTTEAKHLLDGFHNIIVDRRGADLADVGAFAARYAEQAWRLSGVLHAVLHGAAAVDHPLHPDTATQAIRIVEWFIGEQLEILAKGRRQAAEKVETEVLELLETNRERRGIDFVTGRDLLRARICPTPEACRALLARMEADGQLVGEDIRPPGGGRATRICRAAGERNPVPE